MNALFYSPTYTHANTRIPCNLGNGWIDYSLNCSSLIFHLHRINHRSYDQNPSPAPRYPGTPRRPVHNSTIRMVPNTQKIGDERVQKAHGNAGPVCSAEQCGQRCQRGCDVHGSRDGENSHARTSRVPVCVRSASARMCVYSSPSGEKGMEARSTGCSPRMKTICVAGSRLGWR